MTAKKESFLRKTDDKSFPRETKSEQEEIEKKYMQYQILKQQVEALVEEKTRADEASRELDTTINAINELGNTRGKSEQKAAKDIKDISLPSMSLLAPGAYVSTTIKDTENVIINAGYGVFLKKTREEGLKIMEKRKEEVEAFRGEIDRQLGHAALQMNGIEKELQSFLEKHESGKS